MSEHNHEHDHDCGCGCGDDMEEMETMFLTLDDDTEIECGILGVFDVDSKEYIALLPLDDETVLIYAYKEVGDDIQLDTIESDEEFEKVSQAFYDLYEEEPEDEE